jgi:hypothetical protein
MSNQNSKKSVRQKSAEGSGPRIVRRDTVARLRRNGASKGLLKVAEKALRTNPS